MENAASSQSKLSQWTLSVSTTLMQDYRQAAPLADAKDLAVAWTPEGELEVFAIGLDRALGHERGDPGRGMRREQKRAMGELRGLVWVLGSAGALMPFVGLLGTVLGVMSSFSAVGDAGTGGFGVVSAGISEALIATAAGLAVALEAVVFYNALQNGVTVAGRQLGLLVDEVVEHLQLAGDAQEAGRGAVEAP